MRSTALRWAGALAVGAILATVGCSSDPDSSGADGGPAEVDPDAEVTIRVSHMPSPDQEAQLENFNRMLEDFEDKFPNITVEGDEAIFDAQTFNAQVAGGTLPTVMSVPFTEIQALIARGQVTNITDYIADDELLGQINPNLIEVVSDADGDVFGVPVNAYAMALVYNRALYEQAGLDPDSPPTTWEEIRENARAISDATGMSGFAIPTVDNTGGWILTSMAYSNGSRVQEVDGDTVTATLTEPGVVEALEFLQQVRWEDDAYGENILMNNPDHRQAFGAGQIGQAVQGGDLYQPLVNQWGMDPEDIGTAPLPESDLGVLGGGGIEIIAPDATPNEINAALEWIKHRRLAGYVEEDRVTENAEATAADGRAVGWLSIPLMDEELEARRQAWLDPFVNVPYEHFTAWNEAMQDITIEPEPAVEAQSLYASLDAAVQGVLSRDDADPAELLEAAQNDIQGQLDVR